MDPSYLLARNLADQLAAFGCSVTTKVESIRTTATLLDDGETARPCLETGFEKNTVGFTSVLSGFAKKILRTQVRSFAPKLAN